MAPPAPSGIVAAAVAALVAGGCAASCPPEVSLTAAPIDFSLDLTVVQAHPAGLADGTPIARCVVFTDGTLHAEESGGLPARGGALPPPYRRTLSIAQLDSLWALCRELEPGAPATGTGTSLEQPGVATCTVVVTADGGRRTCIEQAGDGERFGEPLQALLRRAAELAWVDAGAGRAKPRRYDFGPDPYARYRRP